MSQAEADAARAVGPSKPWWREPWPWIIMAGPAAAIVGCIITIVLAVQNFSDQAIEDGGVKRGLVVTKQAPVEAPTAPPNPEP
ncbi:FixH family protein [Parapusillimonas sp. JC17]|uniref:FixH family protein n=1 Tax=Parapusillimonas sp. JC17 TaxID=3445768 RepID=UPI003F9EFFE3